MLDAGTSQRERGAYSTGYRLTPDRGRGGERGRFCLLPDGAHYRPLCWLPTIMVASRSVFQTCANQRSFPRPLQWASRVLGDKDPWVNGKVTDMFDSLLH